MRQSYFDHDGLRFRWAESGAGPAVIFQHGLGADLTQSFELLGAVPGIRLISMDCRAHGDTPTGDESRLCFDAFAGDVLSLLDHLGLSRVILGGLSMGAGLALTLALRYPERVASLLLVRPAWVDGPMEARRLYFEVAKLIREHGADGGRELFSSSDTYRELFHTAPDTARSLLSRFGSRRAEDGVARLERLPADAPSKDRSAWKAIQVPTIVLAHGSDPVHPLACGQAIAEAIARAVLVEITPKSADRDRHEREIREAASAFIKSNR